MSKVNIATMTSIETLISVARCQAFQSLEEDDIERLGLTDAWVSIQCGIKAN